MQQAQRRLFISGLPDDVTKAQIVQRFESFMEGKDAQVELKLNPTNNERFAFISLSLSDENLVKCRNLYKKAKWKGKLMRIEEAKPDYKQALAKEWETSKSLEKAVALDNEEKKRKSEEDMVLVDEENCDGRKGWKRSRYGRAVSVTRMKKPGTGKVKVYDPSKNKLNLCKLKGEVDETRSVSDLCWSTQDDATVDGAAASSGSSSSDSSDSSSGSSSSDSSSSDSDSSDEETPKAHIKEESESSSNEEEEEIAAAEKPIPFQDPNVSQGVSLKSVFGFDDPEASGKNKLFEKSSFSILGGSSATPKSSEKSASVPAIAVADEKVIMQNLSSSSLFFLHLDSKDARIRERSIFKADSTKSFQRLKTIAELEANWQKNRVELTTEWKAKQRSALRRVQRVRKSS